MELAAREGNPVALATRATGQESWGWQGMQAKEGPFLTHRALQLMDVCGQKLDGGTW